MMPLRGLLAHLRARFDAERVAFVVGGSFALAARGFPRATEDIDIMVVAPDLGAVHRAMATPRFEMINEVTYRDETTGLVVDLIEVEDDAQRYAFDASSRTLLDGEERVRVLTSEGCCIMLLREATRGNPKRRPNRLRDIESLALIVALDWPTLATWARRMGYEKAYQDIQAEGKPAL